MSTPSYAGSGGYLKASILEPSPIADDSPTSITGRTGLTGSFGFKLMQNIATWIGAGNAQEVDVYRRADRAPWADRSDHNNGKTLPQACKDIAISQQSYYRWRKMYSGMQLDPAK